MTGQVPDKYMDQLESWIGTGPKIFTLLYKITRDGCDATTFRQKCNNKGPTVTVLYNQEDSVYGGYWSASWISSNIYISDAKAFLFQLKYSGIDNFTKFSVTKAEYGLNGTASYGPSFGAGHDLHTFSETVNSLGYYYALNGNMTQFGHSFNNQGLTADKINSGNMNVTELEVNCLTDGQRKKTPPKPWRKTPEWNEKYLETLTEEIVSFKPCCKMGLSDVRIRMLGPVGMGKSSFYNTINSVFKGRISQSAPCGLAANGITIAYTPYEVKVRSGATLISRLCDTRGLEVTQGLDILECNYLLHRHIPDHYEFNPAASFCPDNPGLVHLPKVAVKIHCVLFVLDAASFSEMKAKLVEKMHIFQRLVNRKGISQAVLLTKVDNVCQDVKSNTSNVFTSKKIEAPVNKVSALLGLPRNNILPVKNYENEMLLDDNISIMALLALRQLLYFAEDYLQVLQIKLKACTISNEKPDKRESLEKGSSYILYTICLYILFDLVVSF